ncbi:sensor histidine kinase [Streptomyces sp. NPDC055078]
MISEEPPARGRGARHRRSAGQARSADPVLRRRHLRAVLVPALAAAAGTAGIGLVLVAVQPSVWTAGAWAVTTALSTGSVLAACRRGRAAALAAEAARAEERRRDTEWIHHLHRLVARGHEELDALSDRIRRGERPPVPPPRPASRGGHPYEHLERALTCYQDAALRTVADAAARQEVEILVHIARRLQSLVVRSLAKLDAVQRTVEDPDELALLLDLDHLITQLRRSVESLAVLGGAVPRQVKTPLSVKAVLRHGTAEIEKFGRVRMSAVSDGAVHGHAVVDVTHLLAELLENATGFSPPGERVRMSAARTAGGLEIRISDRGLSMPAPQLDRLNHLLARPEDADLTAQLRQGQIGLIVVARLASRHGITVRLREHDGGGIEAAVTLPARLLAPPAPAPVLPPPAASPPARPRAYITTAAPPPLPGPRRASPPPDTSATAPPAGPGRPPLPLRTRTPRTPPASQPDPGPQPAGTFDAQATAAAAAFIEQFRRGDGTVPADSSPPDHVESTDD